MKELPILFKPEMVRATLREIDPKDQTRRIINRLLKFGKVTEFGISDTSGYDWHFRDKGMRWHDISHARLLECCPYGQPGDRLWVREDWRVGAWDEDRGSVCIDYRADNFSRREWIDVPLGPDIEVFNRLWLQSHNDASNAGFVSDADGNFSWRVGESPCRWRRGMFMFRWASRILLEITEIRVERLQDISEEDAIAEGCFALGDCECTAVRQYGELWESINGDGSWNANTWVWVIEFRKIQEQT